MESTVVFIPLLIVAVAIAGFVLWVWALVDCIQNEPPTGQERLIWVLVIIFLQWLGALLYLLVRRPERVRRHGR